MSGDGASTRANAVRPSFAAGQGGRVFAARQAEFLEEIQRTMAVILSGGIETRLDRREGGGKAGRVRFLRQVLDRCAGLQEPFPGIGLDHAGSDAQQRRFAGAVAAHQANPVASRNG